MQLKRLSIILLLSIACYSETIITQSATDTTIILKGVRWDSLPTLANPNAFIIQPKHPSKVSCLQVTNHSVNIRNFVFYIGGTYDISNKVFSLNATTEGNWFPLGVNSNNNTIGIGAGFTYQLQGNETRLFYLLTNNAVNIGFLPTGTSASDTLDIFLTSECATEIPQRNSQFFSGTTAIAAGATATIFSNTACCDNYIHIIHFDYSIAGTTGVLGGITFFEDNGGGVCGSVFNSLYILSLAIGSFNPFQESAGNGNDLFHTGVAQHSLCVTNGTDVTIRVNVQAYNSKDVQPQF